MKSVDNSLVGKKFKRNTKYGISIWVDQVIETWPIWNYDEVNNGYIPTIMVKGKKNNIIYQLDEILFI